MGIATKMQTVKAKSGLAFRQLGFVSRLAKLYLSIWPVYPPSYYMNPIPLVRAQQEYEDEFRGGFLKWFGGAIDFRGKRTLDLGSGYGGRTVRYKELGAKQVVGLEIASSMVEEGKEFAKSRSVEASFVTGVGEHLPFQDNSFDIILSSDVFEHVHKLGMVLDECWRVLAPGGKLYAVFPPFYHPTGSHFDGFVSQMPYCNLFFPARDLMEAAESILSERVDGYRPSSLRPGDKLWTLNGVTLGGFRELLRARKFRIGRIFEAPLLSRMNSKWESWRMEYYAFLFAPLRWIPLVKECFVHRVVCELSK